MTSLSPGLRRQNGYRKSLCAGFKSDHDAPLLQPLYPLSITHRINLGSCLRSGPGCSSGTWPALLLCSYSVPGPLAVPGTCWRVYPCSFLCLKCSSPGRLLPSVHPCLYSQVTSSGNPPCGPAQGQPWAGLSEHPELLSAWHTAATGDQSDRSWQDPSGRRSRSADLGGVSPPPSLKPGGGTGPRDCRTHREVGLQGGRGRWFTGSAWGSWDCRDQIVQGTGTSLPLGQQWLRKRISIGQRLICLLPEAPSQLDEAVDPIALGAQGSSLLSPQWLPSPSSHLRISSIPGSA